MISSAKEYIDLFISEINDEIQWKNVRSQRELKKEIGDIVFLMNTSEEIRRLRLHKHMSISLPKQIDT